MASSLEFKWLLSLRLLALLLLNGSLSVLSGGLGRVALLSCLRVLTFLDRIDLVLLLFFLLVLITDPLCFIIFTFSLSILVFYLRSAATISLLLFLLYFYLWVSFSSLLHSLMSLMLYFISLIFYFMSFVLYLRYFGILLYIYLLLFYFSILLFSLRQ